MLLGHLLFTVFIGLLLAAWVGATMRNRRGSGALGLLVLALILGVWAGGLWIPPFGPTLFGLYPFPFLLAGLALALAFAVLAAEGRRQSSAIQGPRELPRIAASDTGPITMVLWLLVVMLIGAIAFRYMTY